MYKTLKREDWLRSLKPAAEGTPVVLMLHGADPGALLTLKRPLQTAGCASPKIFLHVAADRVDFAVPCSTYS